MRQFFVFLLFAVVTLPLFVGAPDAHAQLSGGAVGDINAQLQAGAHDTSGGTAVRDPRDIAFSMIRFFLSLLGTFMLVLILIGGYFYFTARGQEDRIEKAQNTIRRAVIGAIIILLSYGVTLFLFNLYSQAEQGADYEFTEQ